MYGVEASGIVGHSLLARDLVTRDVTLLAVLTAALPRRRVSAIGL